MLFSTKLISRFLPGFFFHFTQFGGVKVWRVAKADRVTHLTINSFRWKRHFIGFTVKHPSAAVLRRWPPTSSIHVSGNLWEMPILGSHPDPLNKKIWGRGPAICFHEPSRWFWGTLQFQIHCSNGKARVTLGFYFSWSMELCLAKFKWIWYALIFKINTLLTCATD